MMVNRPLSFSQELQKVIKRFPDLKYDGTALWCLICRKRLYIWNVGNCRRHVQSERHRQSRTLQFRYFMFFFDFIFMLSECDIPQTTIDYHHFRLFWRKFVPDCKLLTRKQVAHQFPYIIEVVENRIKNRLHGQKLWITINETTDVESNKVGNILVRVLNGNYTSKPFLIGSRKLAQTNAEAIYQLVVAALARFHVHTRNILMLVTDGTSDMIQVGALMKTMFPNLLHITCLLRSFHLVAETIRSSYPDVDKLITNTKTKKQIQQFHKLCPGLSELPQYVPTKCETWLKAAFYYNEHFPIIKSVIPQFDTKMQQLFGKPQLEADLLTLRQNYGFLVDAFEVLQESSLSLVESLEMVNSVNRTLQNLKDSIGILVAEKFNSHLNCNPDYIQLCAIGQCLKDGPLTSELQQYYTYASITSLDVERSVASHSAASKSKRTRLTETAVEAILMMQVYAQNNIRSIGWKK